jgi:hypothetical protein
MVLLPKGVGGVGPQSAAEHRGLTPLAHQPLEQTLS